MDAFNDPRFEVTEVRASDLFRRFAALLDDPEKCKAATEAGDSKPFNDLVRDMKSVAWIYFGADLVKP